MCLGDRVAENAAWTYPEPIEGSPPLQDHLSFDFAALDQWLEEDEPVLGHRFLDEHVDMEIDGEAQERPQSPFSRR